MKTISQIEARIDKLTKWIDDIEYELENVEFSDKERSLSQELYSMMEERAALEWVLRE